MDAVERKEEGPSEPTASEARPAERPVGRFAERGFLRGGLFVSGVLHGILILALLPVLHIWGGIFEWGDGKELEVALQPPELEPPFPEEIPEPQLTPRVEEPTHEPELVEQPEPPKELPPDPPAPEPLDWLPPVDLIADMEPWLDPPEPEPQPITVEVKSESPPPAPSPPVVLEGASMPGYSKSPQPSYPRQALRMRWHGTVTLRITVDASGKVTGGVIERSSGHRVLDDAALKAFLAWVFEPKRAGEPDVRIIRKRFTFKLP